MFFFYLSLPTTPRAIGPVDVRVKESHTHYQTSYKTEHRQLKRDEVAKYLKNHYGIDADISNGFLFFSDGSKNTYKQNGRSLRTGVHKN